VNGRVGLREERQDRAHIRDARQGHGRVQHANRIGALADRSRG
jgi:hypothetical protein